MREGALDVADSKGETIVEGAVRSPFSAGTPSFLLHCTPMYPNCEFRRSDRWCLTRMVNQMCVRHSLWAGRISNS